MEFFDVFGRVSPDEPEFPAEKTSSSGSIDGALDALESFGTAETDIEVFKVPGALPEQLLSNKACLVSGHLKTDIPVAHGQYSIRP